jgi:hypothetical protein
LKRREELKGGLAQTDNFQKFQPILSFEEKELKPKANKTSKPFPQH